MLRHSDGELDYMDVPGKYGCGQCLYVVTHSLSGSAPFTDIASLPNVVDRWLVRSILYAFDTVETVSRFLSTGTAEGNVAYEASMKLKESVMEPIRGVVALPFGAVTDCRRGSANGTGAKNIDPRTVERRISVVLAGKDIHLKKISTKTRCYVIGGTFESVISSKIQNSFGAQIEVISDEERIRLLDEVGKVFQSRQKNYWSGKWNLGCEISSIPKALWRNFIVVMSSNSDYNRSDLLLCVRVLKVIEQVVFARTNSVAGPLTVCMSIAGIVEVSPSFVSVQNAMGLNLSYNTTEAWRLRLISEREKAARGAWESVPYIDENAIPSCQFDNWDLLPLHVVKAERKVMPKVNGSLVHGVSRKRKGSSSFNLLNAPGKRGEMEWRSPSIHEDRETFANAFTQPNDVKTLEYFCDVVFGLNFTHRDKLLGNNSDMQSFSENKMRNRAQLTGKRVINFRSLVLSAFKPHGGGSEDDVFLYEQEVVYVDISRESASETITVRRMLNLIQSLLTPGRPGCPRFVVVAGDQLSYKMIVEMWLSSWRESQNGDFENRAGGTYTLPLHEWLVPFPGFFHAEKQAMYSLCKEMLDGLGLSEFAECVGLSSEHTKNILKHSHSRNNRAFLFSLTCAIIIHASEIVMQEFPNAQRRVSTLFEQMRAVKEVSVDSYSGSTATYDTQCPSINKEGLFSKTADHVRPEMIEIGIELRKAVQTELSNGPNGKRFFETVLFGSLLPTLGFHVLSRTGHTYVTEAFWFRLNFILHASNHLKYQELSLFYAFLRGILPSVVVSELHKSTPGSSVMKLPSFTGSSKTALNKRGWTYVHMDEAFEMLIVKHLKSLSVNLLTHLEKSAAWLMKVSQFRSLARRVRGASRAYGRFRGADDVGESSGPLRFYDRNVPQSRTVEAMLGLMKEWQFLGEERRGAEWPTNVLSDPPKRMAITSDQKLLLDINRHGRTTTALHASVLFPETFGVLSEDDRKVHF